MDFSTLTFNAERLWSIMSDPECTANRKKYEKKLKLLAEEEQKYEAMVNKKTAAAENKLIKIYKTEQELADLELVKDKENLSPGLKKVLRNIFIKKLYGKRKVVIGEPVQQLLRGANSEADAIKLISKIDGRKYVKNTETLKNEWVHGIPDIILKRDKKVIELKTDCDAQAFYSRIAQTKLSSHNSWQIQAYLWLTGYSDAELQFCLTNPSKDAINAELERLYRKHEEEYDPGRKVFWPEKEAAIKKAITFDDIAPHERRIVIPVERDDSMINRIAKRVEMCREYLVEFAEAHNNYFRKHV
jgi:hypothetical protein